MATIDISNLPKNEATRPFHIAAGMEVYDNMPWELSENEALLYQTHEVYPDTYLCVGSDATEFLATIETDKRGTIRNRAEEMFKMASLMVEGDEKLSASQFQETYIENPAETADELRSKAFWKEDNKNFQRRIQNVQQEVGRRETMVMWPSVGSLITVGLVLAGSPYILVGAVITLAAFSDLGKDFFKEIRLPFLG